MSRWSKSLLIFHDVTVGAKPKISTAHRLLNQLISSSKFSLISSRYHNRPNKKYMTKKIILALSLAVMLWSCGLKSENEKLHAHIDSLNMEIAIGQEMNAALQEVGVLLDSIDLNRKVLRSNMIEGTTYTDYKNRLLSINDFVKSSSQRIEALEASLAKSKSGSNQYASMVKKLKLELENRKAEMLALEESISKLKSENEMLIVTVNEKETIISEKDNFIQVKEQELSNLETEFNNFSTASKATEGDLYFAQAAALEEAAHRTKLAPRKKKTTQQEALELYRKALILGKQEAQDRINELEKKLS